MNGKKNPDGYSGPQSSLQAKDPSIFLQAGFPMAYLAMPHVRVCSLTMYLQMAGTNNRNQVRNTPKGSVVHVRLS